jgi:LacI family transcriptional regulator
MSMRKVYTHQDIAKMVGVSQSTVSRALDPAQRHLISEAVVSEVLRVSQRIGFKSNVLARRLRSQRSETITLVVPVEVFEQPQNIDFEAGNSQLMWTEVKGVMHEADSHHYDVKLVPQYSRDEVLGDYIASHVGYPHSDGVIFSGLGTVLGVAEELQRRGLPCVATGAYADQIAIPLIAIDQGPGIAQALQALIAGGHKRIAFFAFAADYATGACWRPRYLSYTGAMSAAGLLDPALIYHVPNEREMRRTLAEMRGDPPFTAAFCTNDIMAARLVRELEFLGIAVPRRVAVVGFDNHPIFHQGPLSLSTVDLPLYALGRLAVARLAAMIAGDARPAPIELIPSSYIPRTTS